jgi:hypothetical protein
LAIFKKTLDQNLLEDAIHDAAHLQTSIRACEAEVLQLAGIGPEYAQVKSISDKISDLIKWLEEILCLAMEDIDGLFKKLGRQLLMFQDQYTT